MINTKLSNILRKEKEGIIKKWLQKSVIIDILGKNNINVTDFKTLYAYGIIDYIIDILDGNVEVGNCPTMENFLKFIKTQALKSQDIFIICSTMITSINKILETSNNLSYIPIIFNIFQKNFVGILKVYDNAHTINNENFLKYKSIISQSNLLSFTDPKGIITNVNDKFSQISGYSKEELIGQPHNIVRHPDTDKLIFENLWETIQNKDIWSGVIKNKKKNGGFYWVLATIIPILDRYGNIEEFAAIRTDITKLKELEEQNKILHQKEIEKSEQINKLKDSFLSTTTHELRTPLTAIKGYLSMLAHGTIGKVDKEAQGYINDLLINVDDLILFINKFLDIKKIEAGKMSVNKKQVNLNQLLEKTYKQMFILSNKKKQNLELEKFDNEVIINSDDSRIKQVLINIISNAIKYTSEGGNIKIKSYIKDNKIAIDISDNGYGMTTDEINNLFNEFSQFDNDSKDIGTGIGMFVVKQIIEQLNGSVEVDSEKGKGTTFTLYFNLTESTKKDNY